ncbi:MAG TPA: FAD-dependent monooxygenase [Actinomycetales bacterium]|nr:FAD-dependent monooxygenase [Actinomycetales bacterium]
MTDLLVVGGGPVGLVAGIEAACRGMDVVVVEPRESPVDKACGEGLMPGTVALLRRLGVDPPGRDMAGIRYVTARGDRTAEHLFRRGPGRGVRRTDLQAAVAARAGAAGVRTVRDRVVGLAQDGAGVRALLAGGDVVEARWALGCDGLHSGVREHLGVRTTTNGRRFGLRRHVRVAPWTDLVEVHWGRSAEAYVTPVADDEVGIAVLGPKGPGFEAALRQFPALRDRLSGGAWTTEVRGAGPLQQRVAARRRDRVLLVGDASGYVDALTGEGLRVGLAGAVAAVRAVAAGRPHEYEREWWRLTREYRWLTSSLVGATRSPAVRRALVPAAAGLPGVFGGLVEQLAR